MAIANSGIYNRKVLNAYLIAVQGPVKVHPRSRFLRYAGEVGKVVQGRGGTPRGVFGGNVHPLGGDCGNWENI